MKIAVDFDGTIVAHRYPEIGSVMPFAFETLRALKKAGHKIILWTYRSDIKLEEAVDFCLKNGFEFYAVNASYPEEIFDEKISRKIYADLYIDDRNIGGFPGWSAVWQMINNEKILVPEVSERGRSNQGKVTFKTILKRFLE